MCLLVGLLTWSCFITLQEYVDYNGGPGVQHIALNSSNIIESVSLAYYRTDNMFSWSVFSKFIN